MLKKLLSLAAIAVAGLCANAQETYDLGLDGLWSGWDSSYDPETKTITFDSAWTGRGWWLDDFDASAYTDVVVECEPSTIPVQMVVQYAEGDVVTTGVLPAGTTTFACELDPERKSHLKQIYMQCAEAGTLTLTAAYLIDNSGAAYNPVIWSGCEPLQWWPTVSIKPKKFNEGDRIGFIFEVTGAEGGVFKAVCVNAAWEWCGMTSYSDNPTYSTEYETIWVGQSGAVATFINATDAANCVNGLEIQGDGLNLIKVLYFPAGTPTSIYVTGDGEGLGNWDLSNVLAVEGEFGVHTFNCANLNQFKFSPVNTTDWSEFDSRAYSAGDCILGENLLRADTRNNVTPWTGDYTITIDMCALTMNVETETPPAIYLRGDMNAWGTDPEYLFEKIGESLYRLEGVDIEAGQQFKLANPTWNIVNYGGATDMEVDQFYTLELWGDNCTLASSVYNAVITFNLSNGHILITGETDALEVVAAGTDNAVYYNLQGVEVANPSNGIYLKRVGDKVSKVMVK